MVLDQSQRTERKPVVLDTDIGSDIDDTWALAALLGSPELDVKLVLTSSGDVRYRAQVAARLLHTAGRSDIPVGLGQHHEYFPDHRRHQGPWVEKYGLGDFPGEVKEDGVDALIELALASEEPLTIIAIAPCFNLAEALRRCPEMAGCCRFVGMQGAVDEGYAPGSPPCLETNVKLDVAGFRSVLAADWLDLRLTPLDTCGRFFLDGSLYRTVRDSASPLARACMENYRIWAHRVNWMKVDFEEERTSILFDNVAVAMAYTDVFWEFEKVPLHCSHDGMTERRDGAKPVTMALRWKDFAGFQKHVAERLL
jgi:inosine-uridine nucleoside N-ribohydrolase